MSHAVVPIKSLGVRPPEQGRIRLGVKTKSAMESIDTFRFTSSNEIAIRNIALLYGGEAKPWHDDRANPPDQFEVITTANRIRVLLPPDCLSQHYEQWGGGGVVRRCDGETVEVAGEHDMVSQPCICAARGKMQCKLYTRISVVLPDVQPFGGTWRLETKGWNAGKEVPAMVSMIESLQQRGITAAVMRVDRETRMVRGRRQHFVVPRIEIDASVDRMIEGATQVRPQLAAPAPARSIESSTSTPVEDDWDAPQPIDEAELVDEPDAEDQIMATFMDLTGRLGALLRDAGMVQENPDVSLIAEVRRAVAWGASSGEKQDARTLTEDQLVMANEALLVGLGDLDAVRQQVMTWRSQRPL